MLKRKTDFSSLLVSLTEERQKYNEYILRSNGSPLLQFSICLIDSITKKNIEIIVTTSINGMLLNSFELLEYFIWLSKR